MGVRFLTHNHTQVPKIASPHVVGPVDYFYHPPLALRRTSYLNSPKLSGDTNLKVIGHSFGHQIPSVKYGKEHPKSKGKETFYFLDAS